MSKTRGERRDINERKWISRLKKVFNSGYRTVIMPIKTSKWSDFDNVKTYDELKKDKYGVMLKNTGTICSDKKLTIQEEHKRNIKNRSIPEEDINEARQYMEDINDMFAFEKYCGACTRFNDEEECPFYGKVHQESLWKEIKCDKFYD